MSVAQIESSPQLDSKMDISESASIDSGGASSSGNTNYTNEKIQLDYNMIPLELNHNYDSHEVLHDANDLTENNQTSLIDNFICKNIDLNTLNYEPHEIHIARTLTYNHPLMLSPKCDSDSEYDYNNTQQNEEVETDVSSLSQNQVLSNYPDVIPKKKYVHLELVPPHNENNVTLSYSQSNTKEENTIKSCNIMRASSPDLLSSGSEINISQYQATVAINLQAVALTPNIKRYQHNNQMNQSLNKNRFEQCIRAEDITSLDSISNQSFDGEDNEHNLASLSPSSSLIDGLDYGDCDEKIVEEVGINDNIDLMAPEILFFDHDNDDNVINEETLQAVVPTLRANQHVNTSVSNINSNENQLIKSSDKIPQYSANEEHKDSKNWQKISLPDGTIRDIDMRVIEPYKRVLSHGGYLKAGGHNAIIMFCACHLPDRSRTDYNYVMDNLFLYVVKTLNQLVTDDYVLIYLHGGSNRGNTPPLPWLKKYYQLLDHRLRKSLKNFYLVHPTFWIKSLIWMARPFVSNKFWRKLVYVKSLDELSKHITPLERAAIPDKVKLYDAKKH